MLRIDCMYTFHLPTVYSLIVDRDVHTVLTVFAFHIHKVVYTLQLLIMYTLRLLIVVADA